MQNMWFGTMIDIQSLIGRQFAFYWLNAEWTTKWHERETIEGRWWWRWRPLLLEHKQEPKGWMPHKCYRTNAIENTFDSDISHRDVAIANGQTWVISAQRAVSADESASSFSLAENDFPISLISLVGLAHNGHTSHTCFKVWLDIHWMYVCGSIVWACEDAQ